MIGTPVNMLDVSVLLILTMSMLVAFFRGFIRELLSLGAWIGAGIAALYLYPYTSTLMEHRMKNPHIADGVAGMGTYIGAFMLISIFNSIIIRYVKSGAEVGLLDNFLGLIFGGLRGAFVVSLGYLILITVMPIPKDNPPAWVKSSFTKDYLQMGADALTKVAPQYLSEMEAAAKKGAEAAQKRKEEVDTGYKPQNQNDLNRLMDSTQSQGPDAAPAPQ